MISSSSFKADVRMQSNPSVKEENEVPISLKDTNFSTEKSTDKDLLETNVMQSRTQRLFPTGFKYELKELLKLSWPLVLMALFAFSMNPVALIFSGNLGKVELGAVALAISLANMMAMSIGLGLVCACDTFFSQSFGSTNKKQVGIYFQTALCVSSLTCVIGFALLFNANSLLVLIGQDPVMAKMAEEYILIYLPAVVFIFIYFTIGKWLQVQAILIPGLIIGLTTNVLHIGLQYVCVYTLMWGYQGSALALMSSFFLSMLLLILYIVCSGAYKATWPGWTRRSLLDWGEFTKLGLSSMVMICIEWWVFEIATFLMGVLGATELGASAILFQLYSVYGTIPQGIGAAVSIRVGRYLGSRNGPGALTTTRVALLVSFCVAVVAAILTLCLRTFLPRIFTSDPDVIAMTSDLLPILAIFAFFGGIKWVSVGIVRGTGLQFIGGVVSVVCFFAVAPSIGIPLMFLTEVRSAGFWWGLNIGLGLAAVIYLVMISRTNWELEIEKAQQRARVVDTATHNSADATSEKSPLLNGMVSSSERMTKSNNAGDNMASRPSYDSITQHTNQIGISDRDKDFIYTPTFWYWIYFKRSVAILTCSLVLVLGILCRYVIFIPPELPVSFSNNSTDGATNATAPSLGYNSSILIEF